MITRLRWMIGAVVAGGLLSACGSNMTQAAERKLTESYNPLGIQNQTCPGSEIRCATFPNESHSPLKFSGSGSFFSDNPSECDKIAQFFETFQSPRTLMLFECDGIGQLLSQLTLLENLLNYYNMKYKDVYVIEKIDKILGIAYGGMNAAVYASLSGKPIDQVKNILKSFQEDIQKERNNANGCGSWLRHSFFANCLCCLQCAGDSTEDYVDSMYEQLSGSAIEGVLKKYVAGSLSDYSNLLLMTGQEIGHELFHSVPKLCASLAEAQNKVANLNLTTMYVKNFHSVIDVIDHINPIKTFITSRTSPGAYDALQDQLRRTKRWETVKLDKSQVNDIYQQKVHPLSSQKGLIKIKFDANNTEFYEYTARLNVKLQPESNTITYTFLTEVPTSLSKYSTDDLIYEFERANKEFFKDRHNMELVDMLLNALHAKGETLKNESHLIGELLGGDSLILHPQHCR